MDFFRPRAIEAESTRIKNRTSTRTAKLFPWLVDCDNRLTIPGFLSPLRMFEETEMKPSEALTSHRQDIRRVAQENHTCNPRVFGSVILWCWHGRQRPWYSGWSDPWDHFTGHCPDSKPPSEDPWSFGWCIDSEGHPAEIPGYCTQRGRADLSKDNLRISHFIDHIQNDIPGLEKQILHLRQDLETEGNQDRVEPIAWIPNSKNGHFSCQVHSGIQSRLKSDCTTPSINRFNHHFPQILKNLSRKSAMISTVSTPSFGISSYFY